MKMPLVAAALAATAALAAPALGAAGTPNACKLVTAPQYKKVVGAVTLKTSEGVSTCLVGKKIVTAVGPSSPAVLDQIKHGMLPKAPGIKLGGFATSGLALYAVSGKWTVTMGVGPNGFAVVTPAKLIQLMKLALAKVNKLPLVKVKPTLAPSAGASTPIVGAGGSNNLPPAPALPSANGGGSSEPPAQTPAPPATEGDPTLDPGTVDSATP